MPVKFFLSAVNFEKENKNTIQCKNILFGTPDMLSGTFIGKWEESKSLRKKLLFQLAIEFHGSH